MDQMNHYGSNSINDHPEEVSNYDDRPWRPFRWPYHQTMAIFKLDINQWLDMDKYYMHYIKERKELDTSMVNKTLICTGRL